MIQSIVNVVLQLILTYLKKVGVAQETVDAYLAFLSAMNKEGKISVRLKESIDAQFDELEKRKAQMNQDADTTVMKPTVDPSKVQIVVPSAVKIGQQFEVQIYGIKDVAFIRVSAEKVNPLTTARWSEEKKCYVGMATFGSVLNGTRVVGFQLDSGWVEKSITVSA